MSPMFTLWKYWNSKSKLWSCSGLNFNENGWVVSENEYFEIFAEIFETFLGVFLNLFAMFLALFSSQNHWFFLKTPIVIYNGGKSESARFSTKSFSETTEPFLKILDVLKSWYFSLQGKTIKLAIPLLSKNPLICLCYELVVDNHTLSEKILIKK